MVYAHDGLQPLSLQLSGHSFSEGVPFAAGLFAQYGASLEAERERPSVEPSREGPREEYPHVEIVPLWRVGIRVRCDEGPLRVADFARVRLARPMSANCATPKPSS